MEEFNDAISQREYCTITVIICFQKTYHQDHVICSYTLLH
jgi:hypothetical protein